MRGIELFAGCGGLALGAEAAGVEPALMVERDPAACRTLAGNRPGWPVASVDVRTVDYATVGRVDVLSGGPPCQPFSMGGLAKGADDERDMWPEALRALAETRPRGFLFENVRGLLRPAFAGYMEWIVAALSRPSLVRLPSEGAEGHMRRLKSRRGPVEYRVSTVSLDAADFGVPQRRQRVLFLGVRADVDCEPPAMVPTHSRAALLFDQWVDGGYWERLGVPIPRIPEIDAPMVSALRKSGRRPASRPWVTVREALAGLGEPDGVDGHVHQPGARAYAGHTGSPLDRPAKAIKAGDHGVPGGENMLVCDDGTVRYFTTREAARLQGFPDGWRFPAPWGTSLRQVGNAVPVAVATVAFEALVSRVGNPAKTRSRPPSPMALAEALG